MEHTDDILQNYIPETYVMLLTYITPINCIKIFKIYNLMSKVNVHRTHYIIIFKI